MFFDIAYSVSTDIYALALLGGRSTRCGKSAG